MTGRKNKLVYEEGRSRMVARAKEVETSVAGVNLAEKSAFMAGHKMIAIISEAASSGISLQVRLLSRLLSRLPSSACLVASDCVRLRLVAPDCA